MSLIPKKLKFVIWDYTKDVSHDNWVFLIKDTMKNGLKANEIYVLLLWQVIDTIEKKLDIKKWDVLHFEYHLDAELLR